MTQYPPLLFVLIAVAAVQPLCPSCLHSLRKRAGKWPDWNLFWFKSKLTPSAYWQIIVKRSPTTFLCPGWSQCSRKAMYLNSLFFTVIAGTGSEDCWRDTGHTGPISVVSVTEVNCGWEAHDAPEMGSSWPPSEGEWEGQEQPNADSQGHITHLTSGGLRPAGSLTLWSFPDLGHLTRFVHLNDKPCVSHPSFETDPSPLIPALVLFSHGDHARTS